MLSLFMPSFYETDMYDGSIPEGGMPVLIVGVAHSGRPKSNMSVQTEGRLGVDARCLS